MELNEIVMDYELNFHGKICVFETGYNKLPEFEVRFHVLDLFHILGIHKLNTGLHSATWLERVKRGDFSVFDYRRQRLFRDSLSRIENYEFFYEIFYQDRVKLCVLDKDLKTNTMRLSVVFFKEDRTKTVVIGLKKTSFEYFVPATLHESRSNPYARARKTNITSKRWIVK